MNVHNAMTAYGLHSRPSRQRMLHIQGIGVGIPQRRQSIEAAAPSLGLTPNDVRMFKRLFGLERFPYDEALSLSGLLGAAFADLMQSFPAGLAGITHVFHCHTIPFVAPFDRPVAPWRLMGAEGASLTMNHCATGITALSLAQDILGPGEKALIIIGEKAYHQRIRLIADTTVMGEAAVVLVVGHEKEGLEVLDTRCDHDGAWAISRGHRDEGSSFERNYVEFLESHIRAALQQFSLDIDDVDLILPHNVNTISWITLSRQLALPLDRIFLNNTPEFGHCFGADPFINAHCAATAKRLKPGMLALMVSVGMGLTAASALVRVSSPRIPNTLEDSSPCL